MITAWEVNTDMKSVRPAQRTAVNVRKKYADFEAYMKEELLTIAHCFE